MTTSKSGAAGGKQRKWYLYDCILFIVPYISDRSTTSNVPSVSSDEDVLDDEDTMSQASTSSFNSAQNVDTLTPASLPTLAIEESCNHSNHPSTSETQPQTQQNPRPRRPKLFPQRRTQT
ncbi:hypothetical protein PoB_006977000 [Plakobranchus ocellatus]|uniref:Uncharacterized protein n=1 Tax=Plakobranchus ocellatus TaxID=259542 RepID=A0AAV4DH21_9GAST|nr:hypothetical protein PoB_006977000 [Plakobranchus ocellatus]